MQTAQQRPGLGLMWVGLQNRHNKDSKVFTLEPKYTTYYSDSQIYNKGNSMD